MLHHFMHFSKKLNLDIISQNSSITTCAGSLALSTIPRAPGSLYVVTLRWASASSSGQ